MSLNSTHSLNGDGHPASQLSTPSKTRKTLVQETRPIGQDVHGKSAKKRKSMIQESVDEIDEGRPTPRVTRSAKKQKVILEGNEMEIDVDALNQTNSSIPNTENVDDLSMISDSSFSKSITSVSTRERNIGRRGESNKKQNVFVEADDAQSIQSATSTISTKSSKSSRSFQNHVTAESTAFSSSVAGYTSHTSRIRRKSIPNTLQQDRRPTLLRNDVGSKDFSASKDQNALPNVLLHQVYQECISQIQKTSIALNKSPPNLRLRSAATDAPREASIDSTTIKSNSHDAMEFTDLSSELSLSNRAVTIGSLVSDEDEDPRQPWFWRLFYGLVFIYTLVKLADLSTYFLSDASHGSTRQPLIITKETFQQVNKANFESKPLLSEIVDRTLLSEARIEVTDALSSMESDLNDLQSVLRKGLEMQLKQTIDAITDTERKIDTEPERFEQTQSANGTLDTVSKLLNEVSGSLLEDTQEVRGIIESIASSLIDPVGDSDRDIKNIGFTDSFISSENIALDGTLTQVLSTLNPNELLNIVNNNTATLEQSLQNLHADLDGTPSMPEIQLPSLSAIPQELRSDEIPSLVDDLVQHVISETEGEFDSKGDENYNANSAKFSLFRTFRRNMAADEDEVHIETEAAKSQQMKAQSFDIVPSVNNPLTVNDFNRRVESFGVDLAASPRGGKVMYADNKQTSYYFKSPKHKLGFIGNLIPLLDEKDRNLSDFKVINSHLPMEKGHCFAVSPKNSFVTISFHQPIHIRAISVSHFLSESSSVMRSMEAFGLSTNHRYRRENSQNQIALGKFEFQVVSGELDSNIYRGNSRGSTLIHASFADDKITNYFPVSADRISTPLKKVYLKLANNFGNDEFTCIYRIGVLGHFPH
jgi:hypothetical protein